MADHAGRPGPRQQRSVAEMAAILDAHVDIDLRVLPPAVAAQDAVRAAQHEIRAATRNS